MRIERARYEATRAQRQYEMCEPENRLVARNLERLWETKLRAVEEAEQEFQTWRRRRGAVLTDEDRQQILALGEDLPKLMKMGAIRRNGKMKHTRIKGRLRSSAGRRALCTGGCEEVCSMRDNQAKEGPGKSG